MELDRDGRDEDTSGKCYVNEVHVVCFSDRRGYKLIAKPEVMTPSPYTLEWWGRSQRRDRERQRERENMGDIIDKYTQNLEDIIIFLC